MSIWQDLGVGARYFALSKNEQEDVVFKALVDNNELDLSLSRFDLAVALGIPPSKVDALIFRYRLRQFASDGTLRTLSSNMFLVGTDTKSGAISFALEDKFFRELFISTLKKNSIPYDSSFNREIVKVKIDQLTALIACFTDLSLNDIESKLAKLKRQKKLETSAELLGSLGAKIKTFQDLYDLFSLH